uniref:Uncharacterized protein n=1 Tax=Tanacetum cinerariifolium TaxID=118510 RepID=A0A699H7X2_TANCI|nr:hypothetical protein [Tanacetum cinerariifolium]
MSGSEPVEMALVSSQDVVLPKFDMHIYTSILTTKGLKEMAATAQNTKNTTMRSILQQEKLTGPNFTNKYQNLRTVLRSEGKLAHLEQPFIPVHLPVAPQADSYGKGNKHDRVLSYIGVNLCVLSYVVSSFPFVMLTMDDFLKLLVWNGTVRSVEKTNSKIVAAREKKDQQNLANAQANRAGEGGSATPRKKRARKNQESTGSSHQVSPKNAKDVVASGSRVMDTVEHVVDLSDNTRDPTPFVIKIQPSAHVEHDDAQENVIFSDAHFFHFGHDEENDRDATAHRDTQLEELSHMRNNLQREMQANDGLSKKLALLNNVHSSCPDRERELTDRLKDMEKERDDWRQNASAQVDKIKKLEEIIEPKSKQLVDAEGRIEVLEGEKTTPEIVDMLSETNNLDIEGSKAWKDKHRELFTKKYSYVQKVADPYRFPMEALMEISPDVPPPATNDATEPSTENNNDVTAV